MATSRVTDANVLAIWRRMEAKSRRVRVATATFRVGQHVRISKEEMKFSKPAEYNFIIFFHVLGLLTCSGIETLPSFPGSYRITSSLRFVGEGVIRQSGVVHSFEVVGPVLFVFESHVLYS